MNIVNVTMAFGCQDGLQSVVRVTQAKKRPHSLPSRSGHKLPLAGATSSLNNHNNNTPPARSGSCNRVETRGGGGADIRTPATGASTRAATSSTTGKSRIPDLVTRRKVAVMSSPEKATQGAAGPASAPVLKPRSLASASRAKIPKSSVEAQTVYDMRLLDSTKPIIASKVAQSRATADKTAQSKSAQLKPRAVMPQVEQWKTLQYERSPRKPGHSSAFQQEKIGPFTPVSPKSIASWAPRVLSLRKETRTAPLPSQRHTASSGVTSPHDETTTTPSPTRVQDDWSLDGQVICDPATVTSSALPKSSSSLCCLDLHSPKYNDNLLMDMLQSIDFSDVTPPSDRHRSATTLPLSARAIISPRLGSSLDDLMLNLEREVERKLSARGLIESGTCSPDVDVSAIANRIIRTYSLEREQQCAGAQKTERAVDDDVTSEGAGESARPSSAIKRERDDSPCRYVDGDPDVAAASSSVEQRDSPVPRSIDRHSACRSPRVADSPRFSPVPSPRTIARHSPRPNSVSDNNQRPASRQSTQINARESATGVL